MSEPKKYLTIEEFTQELARLGLVFSDRTIRNWVKAGKIKAIRPGRRQWYIPVEELERVQREDSRRALRFALA